MHGLYCISTVESYLGKALEPTAILSYTTEDTHCGQLSSDESEVIRVPDPVQVLKDIELSIKYL
jgi:hypothetical protein